MKKKYLNLRIILCFFFFSLNTFSQDYISDTLALRAILDSNGLYTIPVDSVIDDTGDGRVIEISLSNLGLTNIPSEIGNITALQVLWITSSDLTNLPPEIGKLNNLLRFHLFDNKMLTNLPVEIGNLYSLKELWIPRNNITTLPQEIENLNNLEVLVFYENNLTQVPSEVWNLTSLTLLFLWGNKITSIQPEINNMVNLKVLNINENNLISLPSEIGNITNLITLNLNKNKLENLPPEICNLSNLEDLFLGNNNLTSLPDSIVKLKPKGTDSSVVDDGLDLGYNRLDTNTLSDTIKAWADKWDRDWRETQNVPIIYNPDSKINSNILTINVKESNLLLNLPSSGNLNLQLYNINGRLLANLVNAYKQKGIYKINWNCKKYSSGLYYFKLNFGYNILVQKFVIIR